MSLTIMYLIAQRPSNLKQKIKLIKKIYNKIIWLPNQIRKMVVIVLVMAWQSINKHIKKE